MYVEKYCFIKLLYIFRLFRVCIVLIMFIIFVLFFFGNLLSMVGFMVILVLFEFVVVLFGGVCGVVVVGCFLILI